VEIYEDWAMNQAEENGNPRINESFVFECFAVGKGVGNVE